ncbi:hypothetical protein B9Z55_011643 [Caenorhabditis nigoni]|nr:hypothetical protein B9Z55_011643 [Caenorhabditis nigoni]
MGVPNGLVKKLLREPLKQIKEFDDYYAQEGEKLGLRIAQRLLERVRWHTSPLGQIERNFESIDFRQAEINEFLWNEPINHTEVLFWKMFTWYKAKIHVSKERPNRTEYLQQMDDLVDHLEVFSAQGLEDLRKFDESYAFYKEEIHLRNAIKALEKVRYGNL